MSGPSAADLTENEKEDLVNLYEPLYSDFTLKCGPLEFKVQRAILARQSNFFKTLFEGEWLVRGSSYYL